MWNGKKTVVVMTLVSLAFGPLGSARTARRTARSSRSENHPTALELLDKYAETQDMLKSVIIKSEASSESSSPQSGKQKQFVFQRIAIGWRAKLPS
jgi:hypothetical protein